MGRSATIVTQNAFGVSFNFNLCLALKNVTYGALTPSKHTTLSEPSSCVNSLAATYMLTGKVQCTANP